MKSAKQITYTIHKLSFVLNRIADRILQEQLKLSFSQFRILIAIHKKTGVSQKDIALFWEVTEAAVSRHIENLIKKQLIKTKEDPDNRRKNILTLTPKGKQLLTKAFNLIDQEYEDLYESLNSQARKIMTDSLDRLLVRACASKNESDSSIKKQKK